jgi:hypothetical protein
VNTAHPEIRREKARVQDLAFKIFAVVGFLSSIVTIISWLGSTQASLTSVTSVTSLELPSDLQLSKLATPTYDITDAKTDLDNYYCNPVSVEFDGTKSKNYNFNSEKCATNKAILEKIGELVKLDGKRLLAYDIVVTNDGKDVAENITLRSPIEINVKATDLDGNSVKAVGTSSRRVFELPDLNPKDAFKLRVVSSTPVPDEYEEGIQSPKVTYSGGVASNRENLMISGRYSGMAAFLDELPTIFQIIVIIFTALFITILWLLPIGLISDANEKRKRESATEVIT